MIHRTPRSLPAGLDRQPPRHPRDEPGKGMHTQGTHTQESISLYAGNHGFVVGRLPTIPQQGGSTTRDRRTVCMGIRSGCSMRMAGLAAHALCFPTCALGARDCIRASDWHLPYARDIMTAIHHPPSEISKARGVWVHAAANLSRALDRSLPYPRNRNLRYATLQPSDISRKHWGSPYDFPGWVCGGTGIAGAGASV
jgi:hypothetical protein